MKANSHTIILGGGIIGLCSAYFAARRGHRVTVVDRSPAVRDGCSFGNAGMVVPSHFTPLAAPGMVALGLKWMWNPESPFYIKPRLDPALLAWGYRFWRSATPHHVKRSAPLLRDLHLASRAAYEELAALPGMDFGLVRRGLLMLCRTEHALEEESAMAAQARALGIPADVLDPRQTAALDPAVTMAVAGSVHYPKDCHLSPGQFMAALEREAVRMGVEFRWGQEVVSAQRASDGRIAALRLESGEALGGDQFVLAAGSWSEGLARSLGLKIPLQAGKGYSLTVTHPRQLPALCSIFTEARVAVTPMGGSLRFGGTMEIAGLNEHINPARVRGIIRSVPEYFPEFTPEDFEGIAPWRGLRPCSPDGLPYLGRSARHPNLVVATGHAMMGLSLGPVSGRIVADLVSEEPPGFDLAMLAPERFA
ncbi:MAG: FAD-dependent oxidoreductase [Verrucomicrobia bacterium]|nr:FAD-dependent oxidoreductase [Verrucomicrobiota bacterium]